MATQIARFPPVLRPGHGTLGIRTLGKYSISSLICGSKPMSNLIAFDNDSFEKRNDLQF